MRITRRDSFTEEGFVRVPYSKKIDKERTSEEWKVGHHPHPQGKQEEHRKSSREEGGAC